MRFLTLAVLDKEEVKLSNKDLIEQIVLDIESAAEKIEARQLRNKNIGIEKTLFSKKIKIPKSGKLEKVLKKSPVVKRVIDYFDGGRVAAINYVDLFSYFMETRANSNLYSNYIAGENSEKEETTKLFAKVDETLKKEVIEDIIMEKKMEDIRGVDNRHLTTKNKEAFKYYRLFNSALIMLKYSIGRS